MEFNFDIDICKYRTRNGRRVLPESIEVDGIVYRCYWEGFSRTQTYPAMKAFLEVCRKSPYVAVSHNTWIN